MRGNLDRMTSEEQQLKSGGGAQDGQRRALIGALAQNNCGAQYASAAQQSGPANFLDALFGNGTIVNPDGEGAPSGTYHTVCVRTCDGYYFPISYSTNATRFADDEKSCQRLCPASEAALYSFRNPGEGMDQAVSNGGQPYTALPNAYRYRKEVVSGCSCRRAGQSWADALKGADNSTTLEQGDIVVTDQNAKLLSQAPQARGKGAAPAAVMSQPSAAAASSTTSTPTDPSKRVVRTVGPPFLSPGQMLLQSSSRKCCSRSANIFFGSRGEGLRPAPHPFLLLRFRAALSRKGRGHCDRNPRCRLCASPRLSPSRDPAAAA